MALYDPKEFPEAETVSPDFTPAEILAWARTKPADEQYDYCSNNGCAIARFLIETGRSDAPNVGGHLEGSPWAGNDGRWHFAPGAVNRSVHGGFRSGWTYGAFADRLEKALAQ